MSIVKTMTPTFRVSFPQVFEAKAMPGSTKAKYGLVALFTLADVMKDPKQKAAWEAMAQLAKNAIAEKWPKDVPKNLQSPFRNGEEKAQFDGYGAGVVFVSLTTMTKPGLVGPDMQHIIKPEEFYAGCFARATVNAYAWTFAGKNGVSFGLQNIQKLKDGDRFGGRTNAEDDFEAAPAEASEALFGPKQADPLAGLV